MSNSESAKLILRYSIRDEFSEKLRKTCNMKSRQCRGGSRDLYALITNSPYASQYMKTDRDHLQVVSGIGHTYLIYKDDAYNRIIYIDPTIAQFDHEFEGIFVGDLQDLEDIVTKQKNMKGYKLNITNYTRYSPEKSLMSNQGGGSRKKGGKRKRSTHRRKSRK